MKQKKIWIGATGAGLLLAGGVTLAFWPKNSQKVIAELGNDPQKIRAAVNEGTITREDAREAMWQSREAEIDKRTDDYFALATQKEREKYLDRIIDEMEARRKEWQRRAATQPARDRERRGTTRPTTRPATQPRPDREQRMAARMDNTPPDRRAKRAEFAAAMRARMIQRGIQMPGGGRGWGGFGRGGGGGGNRSGW